jgi:DNA-binding GntR family transcriptional regulator
LEACVSDSPVDAAGVDVESRLAASEKVAAYLRQAILRGTIKPGERLRQEEIAERLGASRLPVREALRMLELEGLTENLVNRGARVPLLDMHQVEMLYRMREQLEPLALTESLRVLSSDEITRLEDIHDRIEATADVEEFIDLDREFHLSSYTGCAIEQLNASILRLWNCTQHYRRAFMLVSGQSRRWIVDAEHRLILDAMQRRDPTDAGRYLSGHIRRTRIELTHHPEIFESRP